MPNLYIFPFMRKGVETVVVSQLVSMKKNTHIFLKGKALQAFAQKIGVHPSSVGRRLSQLSESPYFSILKREGGYLIQRSDKGAQYKGVQIDSNSLNSLDLSVSEKVLLAALLYFHLSQKKIPPRCKLAAMSGFSLRQVAYALKSLKEKGLLSSMVQRETYVRTTQKEGRVEDTRERILLSINPQNKALLDLCKSAPLKETIDNPVNTNGFNQSDLKDIVDLFSKIQGKKPFSASILKTLLTKHPHIPIQELKQACEKVLQTPFLKKALVFGWQEAVIECYHRQKAKIWERSKHLSKYTQKKLGLPWILKNIKKILSGFFDTKTLSEVAKRSWTERKGEGASSILPKQNQTGPTPEQLEDQVKQQILGNNTYSAEEQSARLTLLTKLGAGTYKAWVDQAKVTLKNGTLSLTGTNRFIQDRLDTLLLSV